MQNRYIKNIIVVINERSFVFMKKKRLAVLMVIALVITMIPTNFASAAPNDIAGHWAIGSINKMIQQNIMKGYEDNTFKPNKLTTGHPRFAA